MLPGYTTCRTGLSSNLKNDNDVNPSTSQMGGPLSTYLSKSPETTVPSATYTSETKNTRPDADNTTVIPSIPTSFEKPDMGKK